MIIAALSILLEHLMHDGKIDNVKLNQMKAVFKKLNITRDEFVNGLDEITHELTNY